MAKDSTNGHLTPTEQRIFELLKDGETHTVDEIRSRCLPDDMASDAAVGMHVTSLRRKLEQKRLSVTSAGGYRLVRMITTGEY